MPTFDISRPEFEILNALRKNPGISQRQLSENLHISLGSVNTHYNKLLSSGVIDDSGALTHEGLLALAPFKVDNAIIMAAGLSSRFAPISYERPKGILKVRGEILIERQIKQLQEAGISDITIVVGYKKEEFFYLEEQFGVRIVINEEYTKRNNNSTIMKVASRLGNTYICSSDDYFTINPFEEYVYGAYYAAIYYQGETEEYCLETEGKDDRIVGVKLGGRDSWAMMGHAYWDRDFSKKFIEILTKIYDDPETAPKLWDEIYADHLDEFDMCMKKYPSDAIWEFDSLDELRAFDPYFIENVDSHILDNICQVLKCKREDIKCFEPLKQGLTNLSVRFQCNDERYVYRHPGVGTDAILSRESETFSQEVARELGIDSTFIYEDAQSGWKISKYIEGCTEFDYDNKEQLGAALALVRKLHNSGKQSRWNFDVYENACDIEKLLGGIEFADYDKLALCAKQLNDYVKEENIPPVLCHNDFYSSNLLVHDKGMELIDWEYSAMADYASDLGTFVSCHESFGVEGAAEVFAQYFERTPSPEELRHCYAYVSLCAFYWFVWALYKDKTGDPVGEWLYLWYRMAKEYGAHALGLYKQASA